MPYLVLGSNQYKVRGTKYKVDVRIRTGILPARKQVPNGSKELKIMKTINLAELPF
jgi:hypothetical protein